MAEVLLSGDGMTVLQAQLGDWDNLNHLLVCENSGSACIVDPYSGTYWLKICEENGWRLESAALTHSHWDHSKGVKSLYEAGVRVWVHANETLRGWTGPDSDRWEHPALTSSGFTVGELEFEVHCTPGHTPGHVTLIGNGVVISGDCLFLGRCGRTDLFGGDVHAMHESLKYLKTTLGNSSEDWLVLPGHQYVMPDGSVPTHLTVGQLLEQNEALRAAGDDDAFYALEFLAFDDSLAVKAKRENARANNVD